MAGLSKRQRVLHGFPATHLTNHNDVGCLAQCVFERYFKRVCIHTHFPLGHDTAFVLVHKFNRVFDADDVAAGIFISMANHGR